MDTLTALLVAAVLTRGGPDPGPQPSGHNPVEITIYDDDRARGAERCVEELAAARSGSTCDVQPESAGEGLEPGWVWDYAPPWARHMDPRTKP